MGGAVSVGANPYTLHPQLSTLNSKAKLLNPTPKPKPLNPAPCTLNPESRGFLHLDEDVRLSRRRGLRRGSAFIVQGSGSRVQGSGFKVQDSGFRGEGSGPMVGG